MRSAEILDAITLGKGVAESDKALEDYFVPTNAFREVVNDEADLVLGAKGSGKTAISKVLGASGLGIPELADVLTVNAFATHTSGLFANLSDDTGEDEMRQIWSAFFAVAAGEKVVTVAPGPDQAHLVDTMRKSDLSQRAIGNEGNLMRDLVERVAPPDSRKLAGEPKWASPGFQFSTVFGHLDAALRDADKRCWILLDRLDQAFPPHLEEAALRGLLRAHADLSIISDRVRTKIFLRSDIFEKVTHRAGFRGLDLLSYVRLSWRRDSLIRLVEGRIRSSAGALLGIGDESPEEVVRRLVPQSVSFDGAIGRETKDAIDWSIAISSARHGEPSPRNFIRLLREAQGLASERLAGAEHHSASREPLLRSSDLLDAWHLLSKARLEDTVYAEHNHLRPFVQTFFRQGSRVSVPSLKTKFDTVDDSCNPARIISELESAGVLHRDGPELFEISPLYRPALEIGAAVTRRSGDFLVTRTGPASSPERSRDSAKELASQGLIRDAIRVLTGDADLNHKNAALAANLAIESRDPDLVRDVYDVLERSTISDDLIGRRAALKFALGLAHLVPGITATLPTGPPLNNALGEFVGTLRNDQLLEHDVWQSLIQSRDWETPNASPWSLSIPVVSAGRLLAVARGLRRRARFEDDVRAIFSAWYGRPSDVPVPSLERYLDELRFDYEAASPELRPYQVVSILRVLRLAGWNDHAVFNDALTTLANRLRTSELEHQDTFRVWAGLEPLAQMVLKQVEA